MSYIKDGISGEGPVLDKPCPICGENSLYSTYFVSIHNGSGFSEFCTSKECQYKYESNMQVNKK
jgi:hypothetical protein